MEKAYSTRYLIHMGGTKMNQDIKEVYWWNEMKKEIVEFVSLCLTCQKVKPEYSRPVGSLQPLPIPK